MGKKVFTLLPKIDRDFRWGIDRTDTIWYPTMTLIADMDFDECERRVEEYVNSAPQADMDPLNLALKAIESAEKS